jgi:hypothetical protein
MLAWVLAWVTALLVACDSVPSATQTPTVGSQASLTAVANGASGAGSIGNSRRPAVVTSEEVSPPAGEAIIAESAGGAGGATPEPGGTRPVQGLDAMPTAPIQDDSSSLRKIEAAVQAGTMDQDRALIYKALAVHDPASLPADLRGDIGLAGMEGAEVFIELASRREALSPELRKEADRFFGRPTDADSFWHTRMAALEGEPTDFGHIDAGEHVRIWYEGDEVSTLASKLAEEVTGTGMWDAEKEVMLGREPCSDAHLGSNGGDGRLDMYLMPPGSLYPRRSLSPPAPFYAAGLTIPQAAGRGCPYVVFIMLDQTAEYEYLRSAMAHEIFHAFQFGYRQPVDEAYFWWAEATATWVEDLIYPESNQEWHMLRASNWTNHDGPNGPLDLFEEGGYAQYGAYIWPFYLVNGPSAAPPTLIGEIYAATEKRETPLGAMANMEGWREEFKRFALWNWNEFPAQFYSDHGEPITVLSQKAVPIELKPNGGTSTAQVSIPHAAVRYYSMSFGAAFGSTGQVTVDIGSLTKQEGAGVQAIIVTGNEEEPAGYLEDWSSLGKRNLCFRASGPPGRIVLVVSNSRIGSDALKGSISVQVRRQGCPTLPPLSRPTSTPTAAPGDEG